MIHIGIAKPTSSIVILRTPPPIVASDRLFCRQSLSNMSRVAVKTDKAPRPRPVYNQAIVANGFVFCSGQLPKDLSGKIVEGTVQDHTVSRIGPP